MPSPTPGVVGSASGSATVAPSFRLGIGIGADDTGRPDDEPFPPDLVDTCAG